MPKDMNISLLFDFYGEILTEKQQDVIDYYYNDDYSLSEISELTGISRQGVRDSIKKSEEEIYGYESKLKIVEKHEEAAGLCEQAIEKLNRFAQCKEKDVLAGYDEIVSLLERLKIIISAQSADLPELRE